MATLRGDTLTSSSSPYTVRNSKSERLTGSFGAIVIRDASNNVVRTFTSADNGIHNMPLPVNYTVTIPTGAWASINFTPNVGS